MAKDPRMPQSPRYIKCRSCFFNSCTASMGFDQKFEVGQPARNRPWNGRLCTVDFDGASLPNAQGGLNLTVCYNLVQSSNKTIGLRRSRYIATWSSLPTKRSGLDDLHEMHPVGNGVRDRTSGNIDLHHQRPREVLISQYVIYRSCRIRSHTSSRVSYKTKMNSELLPQFKYIIDGFQKNDRCQTILTKFILECSERIYSKNVKLFNESCRLHLVILLISGSEI